MGELGKQCRNQFRLECFLLSHRNPRRFVQFQCGNQPLYLVWRVFWALYHTAWIIVTGVRADQWAGPDRGQYTKWFIFLTDWAYLCLTISTIVDAIATTYTYFKRMDIRKGAAASLPWYLRADWCLTTTAHVVSVVTSAAYWGLVYSGGEVTAVDIETHVINSVYVILNICVTGMPMRILHFWFPTLFGLTYSLFSLFYHLAGGTNHNENPYIYPALDWRKPETAILYCAIVTFVVTPILHGILFGIHCLKVLISRQFICCIAGPELEDIKMDQIS